MNELISVVLNVYNGEKFIGKCLESVIKQTYKNLEILIINDGSTDSTLSICESYKDDRIRIINQENMGLSLSRNVGIENAKGDYLYFVDIDDFVEEDAIEYLYNICKKYNTQISTCKPIDIYDYNFTVKQEEEEIKLISNKEMLKKVLLSIDRAGTIWNKLIKKELFNNIRFQNRIINDVVVTYKLLLATDKIAYSNQIKYYYLRHRNSITGKNNENRSIDLYKATVERYNDIKQVYPNFIENEIGLIYIIIMLYSYDGEKLQEFLKEQDGIGLFKKLFSIKILTAKIKMKEKMKILLFRISPKLCIRMVKNYKDKNYKYKM